MGGAAKPFIELAGRPMMLWTLDRFLARPDVTAVVVALPGPMASDPPGWLVADPRMIVVAGGAERSDSVRNALHAVPADAEVIVVHDAARPLVSADVIERCIAVASEGQSAIAAVPVIDTIKEVDGDGVVIRTPDRRTLRAAQTPQAIPADVLRDAHARAAAERVSATDDAALVSRYGGTVVVVEGSADNLKVTTPADLVVAEALLARRR
jgi:2-C-methyl-D-erythritol 4-phosphate cytidylyltransferase